MLGFISTSRLLAALTCLALFGDGCSFTRTVTHPRAALEVTGEVLAKVNPRVLRGYNFGLWMQTLDYQDDLRPLAPATLRFPAGNIGDDHDLTPHAFDTLAALITLLDSPPLVIQTRVFQGPPSARAKNQPEDAAAAVIMAKERGLTVDYWEIGNEPDLYAVTRGDPTWTAERYCEVFRAQRAAILAVDPEARVAGPGVSGSLKDRDPFMREFIARCGDIVDLLTWHIYPTDGQKSDKAALASVSEAERTVAELTALWRDPARNPRGHARKIPFGLTEYGLSYESSRQHHLADMVAALWALETALRLNELGVEVAHYFALQATGGHGLLDTAGGKRPSFYTFALASRLAGELVRAQSTSAKLWVHAARDGERLRVVVINHDVAEVSLGTRVGGYELLGGEQFDEAVTSEEASPRALVPKRELLLPGRSVTALDYIVRREP